MSDSIRPMPFKFGVGFVAQKPLPEEFVAGYRYEKLETKTFDDKGALIPGGTYHNYHVTADNWGWPERPEYPNIRYIIDGFSPNLNKELHVGHLRQLALANSLKNLLMTFSAKFVSLLGASQGVITQATDGWDNWCRFVGYNPTVYYDVLMPRNVVATREPTPEEYEKKVIDPNHPDDTGGDFKLPQVWDSPSGPMIVIRSDGRPLYAYYDLAFANRVGPTHYITGHEQKSHFESLGLGDKHLPMGLVLGADGTKLKSRDGEAMLATEVLGLVSGLLCEHANASPNLPSYVKEMAWNVLCWNFLHAKRPTNLKFEVEKWVRPESPGMYITYTYARTRSALKCADRPDGRPKQFNWDGKITDEDASLMGVAEQYRYYHHKAVTAMDPSPIANFAHDLAKCLTITYEKERIRGGREGFYHAVSHALWRLDNCMEDLGMFRLTEV
jgi:arginyl-tRNA synthetase